MTVRIYMLSSPLCEHFYVGSTVASLKQRLTKHRNKSHEAPLRKIYKTIAEHGGFTNWEMSLLETVETDSNLTRFTREQFWIDELNPVLNSVRARG
jgi:hypothetical protein